MKISCVVLFYERDRKYLENLVSNINENLKLEHEIILIDNRDDKSEVINIPGTVIHQMKCNMLQFEARRWSVQFCSGDFVWFIDADDRIFPVPSKMEQYSDYDEIVFSHVQKSGGNLGVYDREYYFSKGDKDPFSSEFYMLANEVVWNKWFKTSVLRECVKQIPEGCRISLFEDNVYCMLMARAIKSAVILKDTLYEYNDENAQHMHFPIESLERIISGFNQLYRLYDTLFTKEELANIGKLDYMFRGCDFVISKYSIMPEKDKPEARKIILGKFDLPMILCSPHVIETEIEWILSYIEKTAEKAGKDVSTYTNKISKTLKGEKHE